MIKIDVITKSRSWKNYLKNPKKYIKKKVQVLDRKEIFFKKKNIFLALKLSGNREIYLLNKKFRNKKKTTDILSFPFYKEKELKRLLKRKKKIYIGDIIINYSKVNKDNKKIFKIHFDKLFIHGLLHLLGYKHTKEKDYKKMIRIEKKYFRIVNDAL